MCSRPFRPVGLPTYVARIPAAPFARCPRSPLFPSQLYLDQSHRPVLAPVTLAALPFTRAIETRSLPSSLAATHRGFAFYVAFSICSIPLSRDVFHVAHPVRSIFSFAAATPLPGRSDLATARFLSDRMWVRIPSGGPRNRGTSDSG